MVMNRVNEAGIVAVMRLSHAARQLRHRAVIRMCGFVLLALGLAGLAPRAIAQPFPAAIELRSLFPQAGGDGTAGLVLKGVDSDDRSGFSVSGAGDVNGDGIEDIIVGAPSIFGAGNESYVVFGRTTSFPAAFELRSLFPVAGGDGTAGFVLNGVDSKDRSGFSVSDAGDVNGDGIGDLVIGAAEADPDGADRAGESYVIFGRTTGFPAVFELSSLTPAEGGDGTAGLVLQGIDSDDISGASASNAGDINGDGIDDLIIGALNAKPDGRHEAGASYVVFGRNTGFPAVLELGSLTPEAGGDGTAGFVLQGMRAFDLSGQSVSNAGDVNGDGIDDLIIGATLAGTNSSAGQSYVVFGRRTGFPAAFEFSNLFPGAGGDGTEGFALKGVRQGDSSGTSVSNAGDVNGDGIDDLIIGALAADPNGVNNAGESYVVFGRNTGFPAAFQLSSLLPAAGGDGATGFVLKGIIAEDLSGGSVSSAGDVNGDGIDDLIIGAEWGTPNGIINGGQSYVVFGRNTGFPAAFELSSLLPAEGGDGTAGFVLEGIDADDHSGTSVSNAGDVNGDGIDDFVIGAIFADPNGLDKAGETYVVFGRTTGFPAAFKLSSLFPAGGGDGTAGFVLKGTDSGDQSGNSVSNAGDVNGDGIDDLIIGASNADPNGESEAGESYVIFGRAP